MKLVMIALIGIVGVAIAMAGYRWYQTTTPLTGVKEKSLYEFTVNRIDGKAQKLSDYKGKVVVVVNTASRCGLTPQYEGLEALYRKHKEQGLVVLGFPANDFNGQEPGTNEEIAEFCTTKFDVSFPMFSKITVKGKETHPLYKWLILKSGQEVDVEWNFAKFIVDRNGQVVGRFSPRTSPSDPAMLKVIETALEAK